MRVPLDRDVIFLAESGEEGNSNFGIQFMVAQHFDQIDAEYCFAEGGGVTRIGGEAAVCDGPGDGEDSARHRADGARDLRPRIDSAEVERDRASRCGRRAKLGEWRPEVRFSETTGSYFRGLAAISPPDVASPLPRRAVDRPKGARRRRRLAGRARAAARLDAANLGVAEHLRGRLSLKRDPVGGEGDARRPDAARRGSGAVPRAGGARHQRSCGRGAFCVAEHAGRRVPRRASTRTPFKAIEAANSASSTMSRRCRP